VRSLLTQHGYVQPSSRRHRAEAATTVELQLGGELCAYTAEIIKGAIEAGAEAGAAVVITNGKPVADGGTPWPRDPVAEGRRAMIVLAAALTPAELTALSRSHLPTVVVDPLSPPGTPVISIGSTNFAGGMSATQHLLALGHRRIAYLGGPATAAPNQARMHGYRAAMQAADVPIPPEYVRTAGFRHLDGVKEGAALLELRPAPTAIFAACDQTALGAVHAARAHGLRIPDDLSVVGFDDTQIASIASPPLTTVRSRYGRWAWSRCARHCVWPPARRSNSATSSSPPSWSYTNQAWSPESRRRPRTSPRVSGGRRRPPVAAWPSRASSGRGGGRRPGR
jgi:LacI family transcriptional regulator